MSEIFGMEITRLDIPAASAGWPSTAAIVAAHSYLHDLELATGPRKDLTPSMTLQILRLPVIDNDPNPR